MRGLAILFLFFASLSSSGQVNNDYRSTATGAWATVGTWERFNGATWIAATVAPTSAAANVITIRSPHTVTIGATASIDQVVVDAGSILSWTLGTLTIANGVGVDLSVNGEFRDFRGATSITIVAGSTWTLNSTGTLRRNGAGSSNNWQNSYDGGISTIGANTNWILERTGTNNPSITTIGAFYGNLTIQNTALYWDPITTASWFTGASGFPTIKGNFDIGGTGSAGVAFTSNNTNASNIIVLGDVIVRSGSTFKNFGSGVSLNGNLTVNGAITYDANDNRNITFSGAIAQSVNGTGTLNVYSLTISKSLNNVTLNRTVTVDNLATFTLGKVNSTTANPLIFAATATATGMTDASFTNGPVHYLGASAFTYPIGKGVKYCPAGTGAGAAGATTIIWSENFAGNASTWTLNQPLGLEDADANYFIVGDGEGGNIAPNLGSPTSCGVAVNGDKTMHIGSTISPGGGAAYNAGGLCFFGVCVTTNKESRTPLINCSSQSNIKLRFSYLEGGAGTLDNASVYYSADAGVTWALLDDMPKTVGTCAPQGTWTLRDLTLPISADNNPNVQFSFRWQNNDDGAGTDPSFAIDNVEVYTTGAANEFRAEYFVGNPTVLFGTPLEPTINFIETCEYWLIDRLQGANARTVTLHGTSNSCALPSVCNGVARWSGAIWEDKGLGNGPCGPIGGLIPVQSAGTIPNFSPFTLISVIQPLPIELLHFSANKSSSESVTCNWSTATESHNDYFEIQHSEDGVHFITFNTIKGAGNSTSILNYSSLHRSPKMGNNYYRLKQVDNDGKATLSDSKVVDFDVNELSLFPNPAHSNLFFTDKESIVELQLFSTEGKLIISKNLDANTTSGSLNVDYLEKGVYTIHFFYTSGKTVTKKFMKN
jgi:Secretion system C-terminal sorting domain